MRKARQKLTEYNRSYDIVVVGAGFAGAAAARLLAEQGNTVLVLEQADRIGGSASDERNAAGLLIHPFGPHIFHTNDKEVYDFLSRFTAWCPYHHRVLAQIGGTTIPVPFNLTSLETAFPEDAEKLSRELIDTFGEGANVRLKSLLTSENADIRRVGEYVRENIFRCYSEKQWGIPFEKMDPSAPDRVPIRLSRKDGYFTDTYQGMPADGYTALFKRMLDHPNITLTLGTPADSRLTLADGIILLDGVPFTGHVIYTGAADALFENRFGALPYRTVRFNFETLKTEHFQSVGTVNYTVSEKFTRITEFKHLTGDVSPVTTILREYPKAYVPGQGDSPYYPVASQDSAELYAKYASLAKQYPRLHLLGRLGEYKYYNMDAVVRRAIDVTSDIRKG